MDCGRAAKRLCRTPGAGGHCHKERGQQMGRLCMLLVALTLAAGCASDGDKAQWQEVLKDLRGDNMQMGHPLPGARVGGSLPATVGD